jgi:hypothetical protein
MNRASLLLICSLAGLVACVANPVKKSSTGTIDIMTSGAAGTTAHPTGAAGTAAEPRGEAGAGGAAAAPTGAGGTSVDPTGSGGAAGTGDAGTTGNADAGTQSAGGAGATGAAGTTGTAGATGAAGAGDAGVSANPEAAPPITDPCDHRTWTFVPSVVCTTTCAAMLDAVKLPANAIDGDVTTRYTTGITQGGKGPEVAILTFRKPVTLTGINLLSKNGDGPFGYLVESSLDGANFSYFNPGAQGVGSDNLTVMFPAATKLLAVRITQTGVKMTNWWSIHELTVKGCAPAP